jgi:hypothetical protein
VPTSPRRRVGGVTACAGATPATRKLIIRTLIEEIIVRVVDDALELVIRWVGGDHTPLRVRKNRVGQHRWSTEADVVELVAVLARQLPDKAIAAILNRAGKATGRGHGWTRSRVCWLLNQRGIAPYREGEPTERGEVTLEEVAERLKVSEATMRRLLADRVLPRRPTLQGCPWVIQAADLQDETVKHAADARRQRRPASADPRQNVLAHRKIARWALCSLIGGAEAEHVVDPVRLAPVSEGWQASMSCEGDLRRDGTTVVVGRTRENHRASSST